MQIPVDRIAPQRGYEQAEFRLAHTHGSQDGGFAARTIVLSRSSQYRTDK